MSHIHSEVCRLTYRLRYLADRHVVRSVTVLFSSRSRLYDNDDFCNFSFGNICKYHTTKLDSMWGYKCLKVTHIIQIWSMTAVQFVHFYRELSASVEARTRVKTSVRKMSIRTGLEIIRLWRSFGVQWALGRKKFCGCIEEVSFPLELDCWVCCVYK